MKKIILVLLTSLISESGFSATSSICPGEEGFFFTNSKRRNPTVGGFVSYQAFVDDNDSIFIAPTAAVCGDSNITQNAKIFGTAKIKGGKISGNAEINGKAVVQDGAEVTDNSKVTENAIISGSVRVSGKASVGGNAKIRNSSQDYLVEVTEDARISGDAEISENALIRGRARIMGLAKLKGSVVVEGSAVVTGYARIQSGTLQSGTLNPSEPQDEIDARNEKKKEQDRKNQLEKEKQKREEYKSNVLKMDKLMDRLQVNYGDGIYRHSFTDMSNCQFRLFFETYATEAKQIKTVEVIFDLKNTLNVKPDRYSAEFFSPTVKSKTFVRYNGITEKTDSVYLSFIEKTDLTNFLDGLETLRTQCK